MNLALVKNKNQNTGFTIIEIIVVIAIIGILSSIAIASYFTVQVNARNNQRSSDTTIISSALEKYYQQNGQYPSCSDLTQTAQTVSTITLKGIDPTVLATPTASAGTNSITCADPTGDQFGYIGGGVYYILKYRDEATGSLVAINSRRSLLVNFSYTGTYQNYTVPNGVTGLVMEVWGAQGGGTLGGNGGYVRATVSVTPGEVLRIYVGGQGVTGTCAGTPSPCATGGFNGGGVGGGSDISTTTYGGGGATDIRRSPYGLNDRLIVAGGGGSMGGSYSTWHPEAGGTGGQTGGNGASCPDCTVGGWVTVPGGPGMGATQSSGGSGGTAGDYGSGYLGWTGNNGSFGLGADGVGCWWAASGSGGGGYYGGGNGGCPGAQGGGGGSSWAIPGSTGVAYTSGVGTGNGKASLSTPNN